MMKAECLFISNSIERNRKMLDICVGKFLEMNHTKPLFIEFQKKVLSGLIVLNIFPNEILLKTGIIKARKQFIQALKYSVEELNVNIVLLAASTKRLFGREIELKINWDGHLDDSGFTLRDLYPEILFTNGDNGTATILNMEIDAIIQKAEIITQNKAIIINGIGLLGLDSLEYLREKNLTDEQIIIISNHTKELKELISSTNIKIFPDLKSIVINETDQIRSIINCTHNPSNLITFDNLKYIQNGQTIHVIDVAVPYGFPEEEYCKCKDIYRQDGGNAYIENGLEFFFNPEIAGLTENVLYGCFAETVVLSAYLKENPDEIENIRKLDLFNVNKKTKRFVRSLFEKYGISRSPVPFCFGKMRCEM